MISKIEMPRHLAEKLLDGAAAMGWGVAKDLRKILAAPVVERQPEPVYQTCNGVDGWIDVDLLRYTACSLDPEEWEIRALYTAPPELAELQALNADALSVNKTLNRQMDELQATITQLAAEIERLKGGQGEVVGMLLIDEYFDNREVGEVDVQLDADACERLAKCHPGQSLPLYTSQLSSPSVMLPPKEAVLLYMPVDDLYYAQGFNACLDKVKELNQ